MLDELLDALDGLDRDDIAEAWLDEDGAADILDVCRHPVFKLLVEFCSIVEPDSLRRGHGHAARDC